MNANVCTPPTTIPEFSSYFTNEPRVSIYALVGVDEPEACSTTLTGQPAIDCATFTAWTQYTASFAGVLGTAATLVGKFAPPNIAGPIVSGLHAIYSSVAGVNQQFLLAIHDINAGTPYSPLPQPDPIPPFPDPESGKEIGQAVEAAWNIFKPFIEKAIGKLPSGSPWIKVLEGVIASSDLVIEQLKKLFNAIAN